MLKHWHSPYDSTGNEILYIAKFIKLPKYTQSRRYLNKRGYSIEASRVLTELNKIPLHYQSDKTEIYIH